MNMDNPEAFLNGVYCFADGTFKRFPGFLNLAAFVYVEILRKTVKLCTMKAKTEGAENWTICWKLFNDVIC